MSDENRAGDVNITGGAGGVHGNGAPVNINGGIGGVSITGGAGGSFNQNPEPSSPEKRWFEKPIGIVLLGLVVTVGGGALLYYFGLH